MEAILLVGVVALVVIYHFHSISEAKRRAKRLEFFRILGESDVADVLAEKLEIQADGGDSAGDFVRCAIDECWLESYKSSKI